MVALLGTKNNRQMGGASAGYEEEKPKECGSFDFSSMLHL